MIIKGILLLVALLIVYIIVITMMPGMDVPEQSLSAAPVSNLGISPESIPGFSKVGFAVNGDRVDAWLFLPEVQGKVPCIVMGHGLGGTKNMLLCNYAARFVDAGFAVLAFDYRYFGDSEGEPRQLIRIPDQLADFAGAVAYARGLLEIDPAKIALWGTSFGGGHVIVAAANDNQIAAVVAQCPGLDGMAATKRGLEREGLSFGLRMMAHGQRDLFRSLFGRSPHRIPIVGPPGSIAMMNTPDAYEVFATMIPPDFVNEACARINLRVEKYRPIKKAPNVSCPVLLQICDKDSILPLSSADEAEKALGEHATVKHYPIGHFDIYLGENFETAVRDQIDFYKTHLL